MMSHKEAECLRCDLKYIQVWLQLIQMLSINLSAASKAMTSSSELFQIV